MTTPVIEERIVKSRDRVRAYGEVFTPRQMVDQMLDLVSDDLEDGPGFVDKTFLEPAAGDGNFLVAILQRKLQAIERRLSPDLWADESLFALASIYGIELDAAYEVAQKAVLITPARFLFNAGQTPKAWNAKMLADPRLTVPHYVANSDDLFPGTEIMGGVAVSYWDATRDGEPIGVFSRFVDLNTIHQKVAERGSESFAALDFTSSRSYRYTERMHIENPDVASLPPSSERYKLVTSAFTLPIFHAEQPVDAHAYVQMYGLSETKRAVRWIRQDYIEGPKSLDKFKVAVPASRNAGGVLGDKPALVTGYSLLIEPGSGVTQTFITIGSFDTRAEGEACLKYVKSKFARVMLGILKVTQHNPRSTWQFVPAQDFTSASDIDWSKSIPEIDAQLYAKYGLDTDEIDFIESHATPME